MSNPVVLAYTVRECRQCHRVVRWPVMSMLDCFKYTYQHCHGPTDFIEITPRLERGERCEVIE